jgi:light-regulated signal transduction histidine kinase (bacteriophytochrome)
VNAEACIVPLQPYLGLHYPAADIPPQARQLFLRQRVGAIADSSYRPVPLLKDPALDDRAPLDLTHSALRSMSPFHCE